MNELSMLNSAHPGRARGSIRRAAARAGGERGDTMIEVLIAALIVGLIAAAVFVGFSSVAHIAGTERHAAQANELAQQDEERLRGLTVTQLSASTSATGVTAAALYGNASYPETIDGETYTITSSAQFVSASSGNNSCSSGGADYVETASTVTWNNIGGIPPVTEHSLISPHVGGGLIVTVNNGATGSTNVVPGAAIVAVGPSPDNTTQSITTDSVGCAVFAGLPGGEYVLSWPGYITESGATNAGFIVVNGASQTSTYQLGKPGAIQVTRFTTTYNGATGPSGTTGTTTGTADTFVVYNQLFNSGAPLASGTVNSYQTTLTTPTTVFPLTGSTSLSNYQVAAGYCSGDIPASNPVTVSVASGATSTVQVPEPAMIVKVYGSAAVLLTHAPYIVLTDTGSNCSNHQTTPPTQIPTATKGALVNPAEPYGTFTVCASYGGFLNTTTVANTSFATGNVASINLYSGQAGYTAGACT